MSLGWYIVPLEEIEERELNRCNVTRGPRSKIQCEIDSREHPEFHAGRGARGQWFFWPCTT